MKTYPASSNRPHSPFRWWVALAAALALLLASLAAAAVSGMALIDECRVGPSRPARANPS